MLNLMNIDGLVGQNIIIDLYMHHHTTYITFIYPRIFRVAYAANISEHLTII